ncbi:MAG: TAT-variant-translocated molybdopterin oxidoreductase [Vicinamibacterales bacterium]
MCQLPPSGQSNGRRGQARRRLHRLRDVPLLNREAHMSSHVQTRYWKSLEERDGTLDPVEAAAEFLGAPTAGDSGPSRRSFLRAAGFGLTAAALSDCARAPVERAIPFLVQPEEVTPGRASYYASTCGACSAGCGLLVKTRDGRPIKLEGNPDHPLSRGGLCALGQASILGLYDSRRLTRAMRGGQPSSWEEVDRAIGTALDDIRTQGGAVRFLTGTVTSPTERAAIGTFLTRFADARHVTYDALSSSALLDAQAQTHGTRVVPRFRFEQAEVIVAVDADFLGTWISPVEYTAGYSAGRSLQRASGRFSHHTQIESRLSVTGARADLRLTVAPAEVGLLVAHLAERVARLAGGALSLGTLGAAPVAAATLDAMATRLWQARENGLVVCGSQDVAAQTLCNVINQTIGAYGHTVDIEHPSYQRAGSDRDLERLVGELENGAVAALFVAAVNPVYELPGGQALAAAVKRAPLVVSFADHLDETSSVAQFVCPASHYLESWSDAEPVAGVVCVTQPAIRPLGATRPIVESLAVWSGTPAPAYDLVRAHWSRSLHPRALVDQPFDAFWDEAVMNGLVDLRSDGRDQTAFKPGPWPLPAAPAISAAGDRFGLVLYPTVAMLDGRAAHNPWLHELPDPITKVTWDNYASFAPAAAASLGVADGDIVRLEVEAGGSAGGSGAGPGGDALELPAHVQPGQHDRVVAVALGYGRLGTDRFANVGPRWLEAGPTVGDNGLVGTNAAPLAAFVGGAVQHSGRAVRVTKTGRRRALAATQIHHLITVPAALAPAGGERRPVVQETTLEAYRKSPTAGSHGHHAATDDLWPADHPYTGHRWAMVIDLTACTGCSACVIACQAENNVPVVGRDEVLRRREMHWIRLDRYYADRADGGVDVVQQPMLCQHCENASCEVVCPVLATVHSEEGLNQQVYNRCVGTRYCANNCAYKVRRFNWFEYVREDRLQNLALNPDVVARSRGVMEKCSLCVQRIQDAKVEARRLGQPLAPTAVQTACQQSCPARAIAFGDVNDPASAVAGLVKDPRYFRVLEEINVRPSVGYLTLVRNRAEGEGDPHHA